jgi:cytochrome c6
MKHRARSSKQVRGLVVTTATLAACLVVASAWSETADPAATKTKYKSNCTACHGQDGAGTALGKSMQIPDLRSPEVQKHSDAELASFIMDGKGNMPSFKKSLNGDQIRSLVQYVRELARKKNPSPN